MAESELKKKRGRPRKVQSEASISETVDVNPIKSPLVLKYNSSNRKPRSKAEALKYLNGYKKPPKEFRWTEKYMAAYGVGLSQHKVTGRIPPPDEGSKWSKKRDEHLFAYLSNGGLSSIWLQNAGLTRMDLSRRKAKDLDFANQFDKAREQGADAMAEEALEIASKPLITTDTVETVLADGGVMRAVKTYDNVYARKLAFQARLQLLAKWQPDRYGDKISVNVNDSRAQQILEARKRLLGR